MTVVASDVWGWLGPSGDREGQANADAIMQRLVDSVEALWLRDWSSVISVPATLTYSDHLVTVVNHHIAAATEATFAGLSGGAPLVNHTTYHVRDVTADTFKVAATAGGAAIDLTSDGTGWVWTDPRPSYVDQALVMQAANYYSRRKTSNGIVAGSDTMGPFRVSRFDPDIERLLRPSVPAIA